MTRRSALEVTRRWGRRTRRLLRWSWRQLHQPRRQLAVLLLGASLGILWAGIVARGEAAGADAHAYWAAVRLWLAGGDPYHPTGPFLPYVYPPWLLPLFVPWALFPWDVAWFVWRSGTLLGWLATVDWAYRRRPLSTALAVALLIFPVAANVDTGNVNLVLTLLLWSAQFVPPVWSGTFWALATWTKWVPAPLWLILAPRGRFWGLIALAVAGLLSLLTLPWTIVQLEALVGFGPRPPRVDYLVFLWALVPWWWRHGARLPAVGRWPAAVTRLQRDLRSWPALRARLRRFLGLPA
jgi:hypothetical protein